MMARKMKDQKTRVFLLCAGLGRINRGYESFTRECFEALVDEPALDLTLFQGGGRSGRKQVRLWVLPRTNPVISWLGQKLHKDGYGIEQITFALSLLPWVVCCKPEVIYFSDGIVGKTLWHWRRLTRQKFKLLLSNGGPLPPPFPRWDFVQQLAPPHIEKALAAGQDADKQGLLPYGVRMESVLPLLSVEKRAALRRSLDLPEDRPIVLSVGAINKGHKRMDYLVREVAALPHPRPFLVMLGQEDEETPEIRALAEQALGADGYQIRTVNYQEVSKYYQMADIFVLASLSEGLPRVILEAMSWGLPCLAHDYALDRYAIGASGLLADFEQSGSLTVSLRKALQEGYDLAARRERHQDAFERFSWQRLGPRYVEMLQACANL